MPIVFAQPEPMAPEIQAAGGRAQIMQQNNQTLARLYETAMQGDTQASIASAHNATQAGIAHGQQVASATAAEEQNALRRQEFQAQQQPSERDQYLIQARMQEQEQHAMLQGWLQNQQMTQAEVMQKQKLENGLGGLQEAFQNGTINQKEFNEGVMMLKTHLDPLQKKAEDQKLKMMQEQHDMLKHQNAAAETMEQQDQAFALGQFDQLPLVTDPSTGKQHRMLRDRAGKWYDPFEAANKAASTEKPLDENGLSAQEYARQRHAVIRELDKKIAERDKMTAFQAETGKPIGKPGSAGITAEERRRFLEEDLQDAGLAPEGWKPSNKGTPADTTASSFPTATPGASDVPGGASAPIGQAPTVASTQAPPPVQELKPFDWTKPDTMHPLQRKQIADFDATRTRISARRDIPEEKRWAAEDAITQVKELLGRWGTVARMPGPEKKKYDEAKKTVLSLPSKPIASSSHADYYRQPSSLGILAR